MRVRFSISVLSLLTLAAGGSRPAFADPVPYPNPGTAAPTSFVTGLGSEVTAYFDGTTAGFHEQVGLYVNGVLNPAGFIFPNLDTALGTSVDLGFAPAGSHLIFALQVYDGLLGGNPTGTTTAGTGNLHYTGTPSYTLYSVPSDAAASLMNSDGSNHAYITPFTAADSSAAVPVTGTYVGFEDLLTDGNSGTASDLNYGDEQFVVRGVSVSSSVPAPASLPVFAIGMTSIGVSLLRKRRRQASMNA